MLTLGLLLLGEHVFKEWTAVTGGSGVGRGVAQPTLFGSDLTKTYAVGPLLIEPAVSLYLLALILLIGCAVAARNLARSRTGRAFSAVRDRDVAARLMGVNITRTKSLAFMISSAYAGLAGALMSLVIGRIAPEQWNLFMSIDFLAIVVIGGAATISGSIIGACFVVLLPTLLESVSQWVPWISTSGGGLINVFQLQSILFGLLIITFMILEPRGIFGLWHRVRTYFKTWPFSY